jgi:uncharacterized membrane protein
MWRGAARRFGLMLGAVVGITAVVASLLGLLVGVSLDRAVSLGFYAVGSFLVIIGFFIGNRGPIRAKGEDAAMLGLFPIRRRWAEPEEHERTINDSALLVVLGFLLIVLGIAVDTRYDLI